MNFNDTNRIDYDAPNKKELAYKIISMSNEEFKRFIFLAEKELGLQLHSER